MAGTIKVKKMKKREFWVNVSWLVIAIIFIGIYIIFNSEKIGILYSSLLSIEIGMVFTLLFILYANRERIIIKENEIGIRERRISDLIISLHDSSSEINILLDEIKSDIDEKNKFLNTIQQEVDGLEKRENDLKGKVQKLEAISPESMKYFTEKLDESLEKRERRGFLRDLALFIAGVIASGIVAYILTRI